MKKIKGMIYPKHKTLKEVYVCSVCLTRVDGKDIYYYVDGNNFAITNSSKGICNGCLNK